MNDIQHWRRMIQPNRTRTPAVEPDDSDGAASPVTPRRGLKPKISSIFTHHGAVAKPEPSPNDDPFAPRLPIWPSEQSSSLHPDAEGLIDSVMCRLMTDPYGSLDPRFNSMLMHVFESYRDVLDEKQQLQEQASEASHSREALLCRLQQAQKQWSQERQDYKAEIKRLELLLAKGKRGLAEVTIARQESQYRQRESVRRSEFLDDGLRTIFEVLERTQQSNEKTWGTQRAVLRPRQVSSPSARMRRISQQLASRDLMTGGDPPLGTPPTATPRMLSQASAWESQRTPANAHRSHTGLGTIKTTLSDDTSSTFSCKGDWLPDEPGDAHSVGRASSSIEPVSTKRAGSLVDRPDGNSLLLGPKSDPSLVRHEPRLLNTTVNDGQKAAAPAQRHPSIRAKAAGLFQKLRPHATSDPSEDLRFSFQTGEDSFTVATQDTSARSLRKSMSLTSLPGPTMGTALSPVIQSPTTSETFSEAFRASKIPMPVYSSGSLARPRRERDDSASSLLTTAKSEGTISPIPYSAPSRQRIESHIMTMSDSRANRPAVMQGNAFAEADARDRRRAYIAEQSDCVGPRSLYTKAYAKSDMSGSQKENVQPMNNLDS